MVMLLEFPTVTLGQSGLICYFATHKFHARYRKLEFCTLVYLLVFPNTILGCEDTWKPAGRDMLSAGI